MINYWLYPTWLKVLYSFKKISNKQIVANVYEKELKIKKTKTKVEFSST